MAAFILFAPLALFVIGAVLALPQSERWVGSIPDRLLRAPAVLAVVVALMLSLVTPARATLPPWLPGGDGTAFGFGVDRVNLPFAWAITLLSLSVVFILPSPLYGPDRRTLAENYALAASSLSLVLAANAVTWAVTWLAVDLILFWAWHPSDQQELAVWHPYRGLGLNMLGGLSLLAAGLTLHSRDGSLTAVTGASTTWAPLLLTLAAAIRLGLYPVHWGLPLPWRAGSTARSLQYLIPVSAGVYLATRTIPLVRSDVPGGGIWVAGGVVGLLVAGVLAWAAHTQRERLVWLGVQQACIVLVAAGLQVPQRGIIILLQGLNLLLAVAVLATLEGLDVPAVPHHFRLSIRGLKWFAAGSLLGLPPTLGFTTRWALYRTLLEGPWWWIVWLSVLGTGLAIPAVVRLLDHRAAADADLVWQPGALVAIASLGLPLIALSLQPLLLADFVTAVAGGSSADYLSDVLRATGTRLGILIVLALFLPILGYWLSGEGKGWTPTVSRKLLDILGLEWLSRWIQHALAHLSALLLNLLAPISGERYLSWMMLFVVIVALILLR